MQSRLDLPAVAYLRTQPTLRPGEIYAALAVSRQRVHQWRARGHGFPPTVGGRISTAALAAWLAERDCRVVFV